MSIEWGMNKYYKVYSQSGNEWTTATYNNVDKSFQYWEKKADNQGYRQ